MSDETQELRVETRAEAEARWAAARTRTEIGAHWHYYGVGVWYESLHSGRTWFVWREADEVRRYDWVGAMPSKDLALVMCRSLKEKLVRSDIVPGGTTASKGGMILPGSDELYPKRPDPRRAPASPRYIVTGTDSESFNVGLWVAVGVISGLLLAFALIWLGVL